MRVLVVGGGVAGLAAAHRVRERGFDVRLVEQAPRLGGKLHTGPLAETGAEAFLVRDPQTGEPSAAAELVEALGLTGGLVHPAVGAAAVVVDGELRPIPAGTLFGIPSTVDEKPSGRPLLEPGQDVAVGALVRQRHGDETVDRYVDPMLGGVYAGRADRISLAMAIPALAAACREHDTLSGAVRAVLSARRPGGPVFASLRGGVSRLVDALAERVGRERIVTGEPVRVLDPAQPTVLAVPARRAARLLSAVDSLELDYASVALVTLVLPETPLPELSGFLVPATEGYTLKAATFLDRKWPHLRRPGRTLLRVSIGRHGEEATLQRPDHDLVSLAAKELGAILGRPVDPVDAAVHRWGGALPQYPPGHPDRVARVRAALPPMLAVAGAAYDGVGIPACLRSGRAAADRVLDALEQSGNE